jgi:hypothetical protein
MVCELDGERVEKCAGLDRVPFAAGAHRSAGRRCAGRRGVARRLVRMRMTAGQPMSGAYATLIPVPGDAIPLYPCHADLALTPFGVVA